MSSVQEAPTQAALTTDEIQNLLETNYVLLKAIIDQQNLGRMGQMQEYQVILQQNLTKLAAAADKKQPANQ